MVKTGIGAEIRKLRFELGVAIGEDVSQNKLGIIMGEVTGQTIYNYENNLTTPPGYFVPYLRSLVTMAQNEKTALQAA